jgi:RHS repeat-associated protein
MNGFCEKAMKAGADRVEFDECADVRAHGWTGEGSLSFRRSVKTCYDIAGRAQSLAETPPGGVGRTAAYASAVSYWEHGPVKTMTRGDGLVESWAYDTLRLQPVGISVGSGGSARSAFGTDLYYCANKGLSCAANNGSLVTATVAALAADQNFGYDHGFDRLTSAQEGAAWSQAYGYDGFGNRAVTSSAGVPQDASTPTSATNFDANNPLQVNGAGYDGSGNQSRIGGYGFVWDAESRLVSSTLGGGQTSFVYDGDGRRVMKQTAGGAVVYAYDAMGRLAAEYNGAAIVGCQTCYVSVDQLGSTRAVTGVNGQVVARHDYPPFGEEIPAGVNGRTAALGYGVGDGIAQRFTGKERDGETGLDYFGARYFSGAQGRFTSPDWPAVPQPVPYANLSNPQILNLYSYVRTIHRSYRNPENGG